MTVIFLYKTWHSGYLFSTVDTEPSVATALSTHPCVSSWLWVNTLRPRQNRRHFADDIFKCIFLNENVWIAIKISLKFVPNGPINNISALVQIMAWRRLGDKPLSEPRMISSPTHICVTRPQWVNRKRLTAYVASAVITQLISQEAALSATSHNAASQCSIKSGRVYCINFSGIVFLSM